MWGCMRYCVSSSRGLTPAPHTASNRVTSKLWSRPLGGKGRGGGCGGCRVKGGGGGKREGGRSGETGWGGKGERKEGKERWEVGEGCGGWW